MPRTFVLTVAVCICGFIATVALADKGDPSEKREQSEKAQLLKQIAVLKAALAKLHVVARQHEAEALHARKQAEMARLVAEKSRDAALADKKRAVIVLRLREEHGKAPHEALERLEHLGAAIKHLKAAGLNDLAEAAAKRAVQLKMEIAKSQSFQLKREKRNMRPGDLPHQLHEMAEAIGRLSKQVQQLQKAVGELQKRR
jgi:hypothetical protein